MGNPSPSLRRRPTVAVLGAGIMGSSVAFFLARKDISTVLLDAAAVPFSGASRYNEGKIHLGYLYLADPSLETARRLIPGGLSFRRLVGELLDRPRDAWSFSDHNDTFLIHRDSVTNGEGAFALAGRISDLTLTHPEAHGYFVSLTDHRPRRLSRRELAACSDADEIVAAFEVPERSVSTLELADEYVGALASCGRVEQRMGYHVRAVYQPNGSKGSWLIDALTQDGRTEALGPFDAVVNALWEGRPVIDASVGIRRSSTWTHRFRVSLFARTREPVALKSAVIGVGPFGDVKNYDGRNLYLSWYETGLLLETHALRPPAVPAPSQEEQSRITEDTLTNLGRLIRGVADLRSRLESVKVGGGWVYAAGHGALSDPSSTLHRRDDIGLVTKQTYFSVDTGKYSTAPYIAQEVAQAVCETFGY